MGYSDYKLHDFALQNGLTKFQLPDDAVLASGKCGLLVELLADLQASTAFTSLLQFVGLFLKLALIRPDIQCVLHACQHAAVKAV